MSEEIRDGGECVIIEERQRLVGYVSQAGKVCLKQEGVERSEDDIIHIEPDEVENLIDFLRQLEAAARQADCE